MDHFYFIPSAFGVSDGNSIFVLVKIHIYDEFKHLLEMSSIPFDESVTFISELGYFSHKLLVK